MLKGLSPLLLKKYKSEWEGLITRKREVGTAIRSYPTSRAERQQIAIEIKRVIFRLNGSRSVKQANAAIDYLYMWHLAEGKRMEILSALELTHWFLEAPILLLFARRLHEFFWEFIGPDRVPMKSKQEKELVEGVKLLGSLGVQGTVFDATDSLFKELGKAFKWFAEVSILYRRPLLKKATVTELVRIKKELKDSARARSRKKVQYIDECLSKINERPKRIGFERVINTW